MARYPAKIKSFTWVGDTPHLATSGADEAICWPFDGKFGPMERSPVCVAKNKKQIATYVEALAGEQAVFVGFQEELSSFTAFSSLHVDVANGSEILFHRREFC